MSRINTQREWTKDLIIDRLNRFDDFVCRSLLVMFARQTQDEQAEGSTRHRNGVGFSGADAEFLTSLAQQVQKWQATPESQRQYRNALSPRQMASVRKCLKRYAGQLLDHAQAKASGREEKMCECGGLLTFSRQCGVYVCEQCDDHQGLVRCYCGWSASGGDGRRELIECGETI